jgi:hypothetical protein
MTFKVILTILFTISLSINLFCQSDNEFKTLFNRAKESCKVGDYYAALPMYMELLKADTANANHPLFNW